MHPDPTRGVVRSRPTLHLTAPEGWVNDPLGLTWHDGAYHLFYQHVPGQAGWAPQCRWGHAVSTDLLQWDHRPIALAPGEGDGGCWSGSIVAPPGHPARMFYTSVDVEDFRVGRVRVATADDPSWDTWTKGEVVVPAPNGDFVAWRDPQVVHDDTCWRMVVGAGLPDGTAVAYTYRSHDLQVWSRDGELARRHTSETDGVWTGEVWECPNLIKVDGEWVLTVSVWRPTEPFYQAYAVGRLVDGRFTAGAWHRMTYGPSYYAGSVHHDRHGTPGMLHWLRDVRPDNDTWASAISLPHSWRREGDRVLAEPNVVLDARRRGERELRAEDGTLEVCGPIDLEWAPSDVDAVALHAAEGNPLVTLTARDGTLTATTESGSWAMPHSASARAIVDNAIIEVFSDGRVMAVPLLADAGHVEVPGVGGVRIRDLATSP